MTAAASNFFRFARLALLTCMSTCACAADLLPDAVSSRGLKETRVDLKVAERAVLLTNRILQTQSLRLSSSTAAHAEDAIPVYLVQPRDGTWSSPAAVPKDCRCIFVDPLALRAWVKASSKGSGRLDLDAANLLAFMLLHELGHLSKGTSALQFTDGAASQLNVSPSLAKAAEEDADDFAADLIRRRMNERPVSEASLSASILASELVNLSWNMQAWRSLDNFASWIVGEPAVFFDGSYSHPNLGWRVLRVNYAIQRTEAAKYLLETFEQDRQRGINPPPLYQREAGDASR